MQFHGFDVYPYFVRPLAFYGQISLKILVAVLSRFYYITGLVLYIPQLQITVFNILDENQEFLSKFKKLVEDTYAKNGNTKVVLIAHSLGNLYTTSMLSKQRQGWKNKYIKAYICMAGPFGGAAKIMRIMASGNHLLS